MMMKAKFVIVAMLVSLGAGAQEKWSLRRCVEHALDNNIEIKQREIALDRQEIEGHTAKVRRLPNLGARAGQSFSYGRVASPLDNTYFDRNTRNTSFEAATSVSLFSGMQITHNIALAKLNLDAAMEDLKKVREDVSMQVTSLFLQVLFAEEISKVSLIAFTRNDIGNAFWNRIGWTRRLDLNYYDFTLNEKNITEFYK